MLLPEYYMITGAEPAVPELFLKHLATKLVLSQSLVQLRVKHLSSLQYRDLFVSARLICDKALVTLLANCSLELAQELNAAGIHLTSRQLLNCPSRPLPKNKIVAASCHNQQELLHAAQIDVDFVTLSPVLPTQSHPDAATLGWEQFKNLSSRVLLPIYALGGMTKQHLAIAQQHGAHGIAAIREFW